MRTRQAGGLLLIVLLAVGALAGGAVGQGYEYPKPVDLPGGSKLGPRPKLKLQVKRTSTKVALRRGVRVKATCNVACVVKARVVKGSRVLGSKTRTLSGRSGALRVKLNARGKKALRRARKAFRFKVTGTATDATNRKSAKSSAAAKIVKPKQRKKKR